MIGAVWVHPWNLSCLFSVLEQTFASGIVAVRITGILGRLLIWPRGYIDLWEKPAAVKYRIRRIREQIVCNARMNEPSLRLNKRDRVYKSAAAAEQKI
jgi:hypothetical protein